MLTLALGGWGVGGAGPPPLLVAPVESNSPRSQEPTNMIGVTMGLLQQRILAMDGYGLSSFR